MNQNSTRILVSAILKNHRGEILLLRRSSNATNFRGCWQLPEGKIEFMESPEQALRREVNEETNLHIRTSHLDSVLSSQTKVKDVIYHIIRLIYQVSWQGQIHLSDEHDMFSWCTLSRARAIKPKIAGLSAILKSI